MNPKQCPSCGSTNLYQESATIYRCGDCFDKLPTGGMVDAPPTKVYGTSKQNSQAGTFGNWKNLITGIMVAWLVLGSSAITYYQKLKSGLSFTQEEETISIPLDPNLESEEITPEGEFQYTTALPDTIGNVYIVGKFTNKSGHQLLMPKFTVDLLNEEGHSIVTNVGYAEKNTVSDGESVSFQVLVEKAPIYANFEIHVTATTIQNDINKPKLLLKQIDFKQNKYKEVVITGKIQNKGDTTTNFTRITCLLIDKQENTVDYATVSLEKEDFYQKNHKTLKLFFPEPNKFQTRSIAKQMQF